jgi:hypothetical protein
MTVVKFKECGRRRLCLSIITAFARFQVLKAASKKKTVFLMVAPCSLLEVYRRFRGDCCHRYQGVIALMREAANTSETSVKCDQSARRHSPEVSSFYYHRSWLDIRGKSTQVSAVKSLFVPKFEKFGRGVR